MEHNSTKDKNEVVDVYTNSPGNEIKIYSIVGSTATDITGTHPISEISTGIYKATFTTPTEDCLVCIVFNGTPTVIRVGDPLVKIITYTGVTGQTLSYLRIDSSGNTIESGTMDELGYGIYMKIPSDINYSIISIDGDTYALDLPYITTVAPPPSGEDGITADAIFNNVGYNMFGFLGNRNSYFSLSSGVWVNDETKEAKASDLAKAVCHKYGLVWDNIDDPLWIGNYIKYIQSYEENVGKIRYYKPFKTPDDNDANFSLMQTDESGNLVVKGVSMFLLQILENVNGTDGVTIPFKQV